MNMLSIRTTCLGAGMVACVWVSLSMSGAYAGEDLGGWRLFDAEPAAQLKPSQLQEENHTRQQDKQTSGENQTASRFLVFNGVVSSSQLNTGRNEPKDALWINGYPLDESSLPVGVRAVKWRADLQALEVVLSSGSLDYLSPGDSITLDNQSCC